ncbi:response regulator transcription factor [Vallitalea pronyensis]|uniref:Heme response regulator HssR n=1 Tax=Vallitalea pronyensis TaxID=1348613 RepID=A0A8J8MGQ1_9FIRM|nr:response regulator transcription factor [Vallitalea pronyensis]QUI21231.1 response regulator transcription factor [Vallitalea pronyensis]
MFSIAVCEDDNHIRRLFADVLRGDGYNVYEASDGEVLLDILEETHIDMLITDVMMPRMDGFELVKVLRDAGYELPIIMITAKVTMEDKKIGFSLGVDDYMVKPVDTDEILLRVKALLRRAKIASDKKLQIGSTALDYDSLTINHHNTVMDLPKKEFLLLFKLLSSPNKIFTRAQIMDEIWGYSSESDERTVDVHIKRLREKLAHVDDFEIVTVKGLGYKAVKTNDKKTD